MVRCWFGIRVVIRRLRRRREGLEGDRQLCYVAFDVLYVGDSSVIHRSLKERQELLRKVVRPVKGRLEILLPNGGSDDSRWSIVANNVGDVERFFKETVENRDEGIVLKDLGSKWEPGDRSKFKWLKVKPDYVKAGADLDVLIIGGYYGSGRRGGEIAQFLAGLAERPAPGGYPRRFFSFCRVGTGLSDEELNELVAKLKPYFRKYEYPKKSAPSFYQVTNHSKERPDVWIESPEKSVIVSITSDIRTISSEVFAAPYSLRFPRIDRVRYDKPWHECLDVQAFQELVQSSNGTTQRGGEDNEGLPADKPKRARTAKNGGSKRQALTVASHFIRTDVSNVKGQSQIFSNMVFHFVNVPSGHSLDSMHKLVVENGGIFSMNLNDTVTHCVGAESRGIKYEAVKRRGCDVIHYSWVLNCCSQKQLLPLRPNDFLVLSDSTRKKLQEEIDEFSDSYFWDLNVADLKQIFCNVNRSEDTKAVEYYKKKYCPREEWGCFHGCCIYFYLFAKSQTVDWDALLKIAMRRMKVEVSLGGGKVSDNPLQATHVVVMSAPGHELKFDTLLQSFPGTEKHILRRRKLHVVGSQWLEDCCKDKQKLPEAAYNLRPTTLEESASEEEETVKKTENDNDSEKPRSASSAHEEKLRKPVSKIVPGIWEPKRKRGRPAGTSKKGKTIVSKPPRPKRARVGTKPAKLQDISSDDETSVLETDEPAKKPAKLQDISSDDETNELETDEPAKASPFFELYGRVFQDIGVDDKPSKEDTSTQGKSSLETENVGLDSRHNRLEKNKENKEKIQKPELDEMPRHCLDNPGSDTCSKSNKDTENATSRKLDDMHDPVQAMLRNLMPSLGRKPEATNAVSEDKSLPSTQSQEGSSTDLPKGEPVKKKKVSYRELAKQLLKD